MRRVVLVVVDGLRADLIARSRTPHLAELARASRVFAEHRAVFPSATRVNSASIATGCHPAGHGLAGNAIALDEGRGLVAVAVGPPEFRERWRRATGRTLHAPTLAQRLAGRGGATIFSNSSAGAAHMQDPDGHGTLYHRSGSFAPGLKPITGARHLRASHDGAGDRVTAERLIAALEEDRDSVLQVLWICEPDHSQHTMALGSPEHLDVVAGADECAGLVIHEARGRQRAGEELLLIVCSDHGHETVSEIVPVESLLVEAGLKASVTSQDVVLASSGMGALVYLDDDARERRDAIADWLERQPWCGRVFHGDGLVRAGLPHGGPLQIALSMSKQDVDNRYGVRGLGAVAADPFMSSNAVGLGQHGGLGRYETRPFLMVSGPGVRPGVRSHRTSAVDVAPTVLEFLQVQASGMTGRALALR